MTSRGNSCRSLRRNSNNTRWCTTTKCITPGLTSELSVSTASGVDRLLLAGTQYTYQGNDYLKISSKGNAIQESVNTAIVNQELGKSPIEYTNQVSRAKVTEMKRLRVPENVRSYNNLYPVSYTHLTLPTICSV